MRTQLRMQCLTDPLSSKGHIRLLGLEGVLELFVSSMLLSHICVLTHPTHCRGQEDKDVGQGGGDGEDNYKGRLNDRGHWRGWLTLQAATQRDTFSKGIMDKWHVLQAHNSH